MARNPRAIEQGIAALGNRVACVNRNHRSWLCVPTGKAISSCPGLLSIALHAACSTAERIAFRQINKATGNRLRQQLIDEETASRSPPNTKARL